MFSNIYLKYNGFWWPLDFAYLDVPGCLEWRLPSPIVAVHNTAPLLAVSEQVVSQALEKQRESYQSTGGSV